MWRRLYTLVIFTVVIGGSRTTAEDGHKHELPDNLEIIDPKSLGLSDSDVEKFLGNVKLLPIGGDMGNNIKTQILTVGFEGDEKLNLADFENLSTDGLPDKDKEVAQAAFQRFQDFFKNPDSSQDFDKIVADAEANKGSISLGSSEAPTFDSRETTPRYHADTTTPQDYHDPEEQQQRTVSTSEPIQHRPSDEPPQDSQRYNLQAQEVINLLKTSNSIGQNHQSELPKFGGFISPDSLNSQNFVSSSSERDEPPQLTLQQIQQVQQFQHQHNLQQQQIYRQNEIPQHFVQTFIQSQSPTGQQFHIPIVKPTPSFIPPTNAFPHHQHQQPQQQPQGVFPILPQSTQPAPVTLNNHHPQQQQQQIFQNHNQNFNGQQYNGQQQHHQQYVTIGPQPQFVQQQPQQIGFSQPTLTPVHSHNFQPPQKYAHNFTPNHGPQQDAPVTPRTGFAVTPSSPMIPISTVENAIHRPPVVSQHMHQQQQGQNSDPTHLDIVAEIARQQHLRISSQPPSLPSHPPQSQHQGREISQEPLKVTNHQQHQQQTQHSHNVQAQAGNGPHHHQSSSSPVIQQQQQQIYRPQNPQNSGKLNSPSHVHQQILSQSLPLNHHVQQSLNQRPLHQQQQQQPHPHQVHPQAHHHHNHNQISQSKPIQQQINHQTVPAQSFQLQNFQRDHSSSKLNGGPGAGRQPQQQSQPQFHQYQPSQQPPPTSMSFQRPINNILPPQPPPRPSSPTRQQVFFPPPKIYYKEPSGQRFHMNAQYNRPPPQSHFQNSDFRQNLIPVEGSFEKPRFPVRPDPNNFRQQQSFSSPPNRFTSYTPHPNGPPPPNGHHHQNQNHFGGGGNAASESNVREVRHFNFINSRPTPLSNEKKNNGANHNNSHNNDDLLAGGSENSMSITKEIFRPDFIDSIQPSRMVAYRYLTSTEFE